MLQSLYRRATHNRTPAVIAQFGLAGDTQNKKRKSVDPDDPDAECNEEVIDEFNQDAFGFPEDQEDEDIKDSYCLTMTQQFPPNNDGGKESLSNMSYFEEQPDVSRMPFNYCCHIHSINLILVLLIIFL